MEKDKSESASAPVIIHHDAHMIAINKPPGLMVHRSSMATGVDTFALQIVRDLIGQFVYPVHRLDRPTSGVLLFALDRETAAALGTQFTQREVGKTYHAIVRGHLEPRGQIDYPLARDENAEKKSAVTHWSVIDHGELDSPVGRYATARYTLVSLSPQTGRRRQLRRHCAHIRHPIIGDTSHGDGHHNRFFRENLGISGLHLLARRLTVTHPATGQPLTLQAPWPDHFKKAATILGWSARESDD